MEDDRRSWRNSTYCAQHKQTDFIAENLEARDTRAIHRQGECLIGTKEGAHKKICRMWYRTDVRQFAVHRNECIERLATRAGPGGYQRT
jgi:hypothetical protein